MTSTMLFEFRISFWDTYCVRVMYRSSPLIIIEIHPFHSILQQKWIHLSQIPFLNSRDTSKCEIDGVKYIENGTELMLKYNC